jgi:hypothetical protein
MRHLEATSRALAVLALGGLLSGCAADTGGDGQAALMRAMLRQGPGRTGGAGGLDWSLSFDGASARPDARMAAEIGRIASSAPAGTTFVVTGKPDPLTGEGAMLGQRRAAAVAEMLQDRGGVARVSFSPDVPAGTVSVSAHAGGGE